MRYPRLLGTTVSNSNSQLGNIQTEKMQTPRRTRKFERAGRQRILHPNPYRSSNKDSQGVSESSKAFFSPSTSPSCSTLPHAVELRVVKIVGEKQLKPYKTYKMWRACASSSTNNEGRPTCRKRIDRLDLKLETSEEKLLKSYDVHVKWR